MDKMNLLRRGVLGDALRRAVARYPDRVALSYHYADGRERTLTFAELHEQVERLAAGLYALGVRKGDRIAVLSHNAPEMVLVAYALMKLGAWFVPINFMLRSQDVAHLLHFAEPKLFFVEDGLYELVAPALADAPASLEHVVWITLGGDPLPAQGLRFETLLQTSAPVPEVMIEDDDVATMFFTSGTESAPKGVMTTHRNFFASHTTFALTVGLRPEDVWLVSLPLIHIAGFDVTLMAHVTGQTVVMTQLPVPRQMLSLLQSHSVTLIALPPALYVALLKEAPAELTLPRMRVLMSWSSTIPQAMVDGWNRLAPNAEFLTLQGSSETTATPVTESLFRTWADVPNGDGRWVGRPVVYGAELKLVDEDGEEVPAGEPGEMLVRGPVVMKGYYRNPEATAKVFRDGWFHSGDVLFRDEAGNYFFADRKKDMIKTGGENVFTQEVETVIGTHPAVLQCGVFGLPDARWGEAVAVAIVLRPGAQLSEEEVRRFCRERLAGFKVPKYIFFTEELPTTSAGKLLKRALRERYTELMRRNQA